MKNIQHIARHKLHKYELFWTHCSVHPPMYSAKVRLVYKLCRVVHESENIRCVVYSKTCGLTPLQSFTKFQADVQCVHSEQQAQKHKFWLFTCITVLRPQHISKVIGDTPVW